MNVIVSNKYQSLLANLEIDVLESINCEFSVDELVSHFSNFYYNKIIIDVTAIKGYTDINVIQNLSINIDMSKSILLLDDSDIVNSEVYISQLISMGIYNFTRDVDSIPYLIKNPNTYKDVASLQNISGFKKTPLNENAVNKNIGKISQRIIGIKNITEHAGATTLTCLLKSNLENFYSVKAVEIDKNDFSCFSSDNLDSISNFEFTNYLGNNEQYEVILVDANSTEVLKYCNDIIYLVEPGLIQLNKLVSADPEIFQKLKGKKLVLNRSVLHDNGVSDFERESGTKVFYNIPNLDDRKDEHEELQSFLLALGFSRLDINDKNKKFGLFK